VTSELPRGDARTLRETFAGLEPVSTDAMIGSWRGTGIVTGHPMSGVLEAAGWYGKRFVDPETVHPLLFWTASRRAVFAVDPARLPLGWPLPPGPIVWAGLRLGRPWFAARRPTARLRRVEMMGVVSSAMVYDDRPIVDGFRRLDDDRVMGMMDRRGDREPLFFVLDRDEAAPQLR